MSSNSCAVKNCGSSGNHKNSRSFFRFPKDPHLCFQWIIRAQRRDLFLLYKEKGATYLYNTYRICSDHFDLRHYRNPNMKSQGLIKGALPNSIPFNFLPTANHSNEDINALKDSLEKQKKRIKQLVQQVEHCENVIMYKDKLITELETENKMLKSVVELSHPLHFMA